MPGKERCAPFRNWSRTLAIHSGTSSTACGWWTRWNKSRERRLSGLNLTFEVRDGVAHHCGEAPAAVIVPNDKSDFLRVELDPKVNPATLEGCLVRMMDYAGYAPQDFHDLLKAELISGSSPQEVKDDLNKALPVLGNSMRRMYRTLVADIVKETSRAMRAGKKEIRMSRTIYSALHHLMQANQKVIMSELGDFESDEIIPRVVRLFQHYKRTDSAFNYNSFVDRLTRMTDETLVNEFEEKLSLDENLENKQPERTGVGPYPSPDGK